jgi:hypothetical protein
MKECMVLLLVCVRRTLLNSWEKTWFKGEFLDKQLQHCDLYDLHKHS